jgi:adenylate cyclase
VHWSRRSIVDASTNSAGLRYLAASLAHMDRLEEAQRVITDLIAVQPSSTLSRSRSTPLRYAWMVDLYIEGLRKAGLPK